MTSSTVATDLNFRYWEGRMKNWYWVVLGLSVAVGSASCSSSDASSVTCGAGTVLQGTECVASVGVGGSVNEAGNGGASNGGASHHAGTAGDNVEAGAGGDGGLGDAGTGNPGTEAGSGGEAPNTAGSSSHGGSSGSSASNGGSGGSNASNGGSGGSSASNGGSGGSSAGAGNVAGNGGAGDLITSALDCGSRDVTGATVLTDPITQDTTWSGVVHLPNGLSVHNEPTVTIMPGTKVIVGHNASLEFGYLGSHATIVAKGTVEQPIKFCGETDTAGYWAGLIFRSGVKSASVLRNVLITDGGATDAGLTLEMPLLVQGVQVRNSGVDGVHAAGFDPASAPLIVTGSKALALKATAAKGVEVPVGSQLTGNGTDVIDIGFTSFNTDLTFRDLGVAYRQLGSVSSTVASAASPVPVVTFEAGVNYEIDRQQVLALGNANVHALGTTAKPIIFQRLPCALAILCDSVSQTTDIGGRITANGPDLRFENVEIRRFGWVTSTSDTANGAVTITGSGTLKVDHVKITGAGGYGLKVLDVANDARTFTADSNNLEISTSYLYAGLWLGCATLSSLPSSVVFDPNTAQSVKVQTYTLVSCLALSGSTTLWPGASPYSIQSVDIPSGASLIMQPGAALRFQQNYALTVESGGTLKALGTSATLDGQISFLLSPFTNNTKNWLGIVANAGSTVQLDYTTISNAGVSGGAAVTAKTPIQFTHSTINFSNGAGVAKTAADTTDYVTGNTFNGVTGANVVTLP